MFDNFKDRKTNFHRYIVYLDLLKLNLNFSLSKTINFEQLKKVLLVGSSQKLITHF